MISKSSFWTSLWENFRLERSSFSMTNGYLVPSNLKRCVKLSEPCVPWMAMSCLAKYRSPLMIAIKYDLLSFLESAKFLFTKSPISFDWIAWYEAAALWQFGFWWSLKHFGAFFQEWNPLLMYFPLCYVVTTIFLSLIVRSSRSIVSSRS